jgi:type VI protein secretion system component Hcp
MSDETKKHTPELKAEAFSNPLPESELEKVAGGVHDLSFTRTVDKASPVLMQASTTQTKQ